MTADTKAPINQPNGDAVGDMVYVQMVNKVRQIEMLNKCEGAIIGARILITNVVSALQDVLTEKQEKESARIVGDLGVAFDERTDELMEIAHAEYQAAMRDLKDLEDEMARHMEGKE